MQMHGQLDIWDYDDCCGNGRHAPDALDLEPPHESSEKALSLYERGRE